jgi:nucleoid-associated protein YgaU
MRFVRVNDSAAAEASTPAASSILTSAGPDEETVHQVVGGGSEAPGSGERLEDIAFLYYGDPSKWRLIAEANDVVDPSSIAPGTVLRIPPSPEAGGGL